MPGIVIGDIGPKSLGGFASTDNGFARFDHVRIPKIYMLSKFSQITDDGKYIQPPHAKLSYGGVSINQSIVTPASDTVFRCCTSGQVWQAELDGSWPKVRPGESHWPATDASVSAATVSIRYATVRRQGEKGPDGLERQIISYPTVHSRLLPILSHAYVFIHLGKTLVCRMFSVMSTRN